jgi:hypothetical protein
MTSPDPRHLGAEFDQRVCPPIGGGQEARPHRLSAPLTLDQRKRLLERLSRGIETKIVRNSSKKTRREMKLEIAKARADALRRAAR